MSLRAFRIITFILFRILLPLILLIAAIVRYNVLSFVYLVCLLIIPLLESPTRSSMKGLTGLFLNILIPVSLLPTVGHIMFYITLVAMSEGAYRHVLMSCSYTEKMIRQIGFQRLDQASIWNIMRLVVPDAIVFITVTFTLALVTKFGNKQANTVVTSSKTPLLGGTRKKIRHHFLKLLLDCYQGVVLLAAGTIVPSLLGGTYFLMFLLILTLWGCYKSMSCHFIYVRILLLIYTGTHILLLHLYQFQFFQDAVPPASLSARLIGLTGVIQTSCSSTHTLIFHEGIHWSYFVNPGVLLVLYWILAISTNMWIHFTETVNDQVRKSQKRRLAPQKVHVVKQINRNQLLVENENSDEAFLAEKNSASGTHETLPEDMVELPPSLTMLKRKPWMSVIFLMMRHSYVLSLIAMMAWSITYHSWMTFVFLSLACLLWVLPNSRSVCLWSSPFILTYAELLLIGQYVFCMNLDKELPREIGNYKLDHIGLRRIKEPFLSLNLQAFFIIFIVMTMRQYMNERKASLRRLDVVMHKKSFITKIAPPLDMQYQTYDCATILFIGNYLWMLMCKYWIFFCSIMMAVISLQDVVIFRIIYMILFLIFVTLFKLSFRIWRALNLVFWWVVVVYSMLVLTLIYTFQFDDFHSYWSNFTGFSDDVLKDIGLEKYDTAGLFVKLLTPTSFLVFVIVQLRYFHTPFLELSDLDRYADTCRVSDTRRDSAMSQTNETTSNDFYKTIFCDVQEPNRSGSLKHWLLKTMYTAYCLWDVFLVYLWRLGEMHIFKVMTFTVIIVSVSEVSALTAVYVILIAIFLPMPQADCILSYLLYLWTTVIILVKMIFQLRLIDETGFWITQCKNVQSSALGRYANSIVIEEVNLMDSAEWFGLKKIETDNISIAHYVWLYLLILITSGFESVIIYHQRQYFNNPAVIRPVKGILFAAIRRSHADEGLISCIKFFANYAFYKFGLEFCYIMTAVLVCVRVDAVALLYMLMVSALMMMSRNTVAKLWPIYNIILTMFLAIQFLAVLGFPQAACINYPWSNSVEISSQLRHWLYLPEYSDPPHSLKLIADFIQLLFVSLQASVFSIEGNKEKMEKYGGGDNADVLEDVEKNLPIPCMDFTLEQKKGIETVKYLVFENMFWVTMAVIFITGATEINIFSFFYMMAFFFFMWYGKEFFTKPLRLLLRVWNYLIGYCLLVMFMKTTLQLIGCYYVKAIFKLHQCWLIQLFGIHCTLPDFFSGKKTKCLVEGNDASLALDVVCLTFMLLQRRIFSSHYFRHTADTIQARNNLVERGAELINRILIREVRKQNTREQEILMNIKKQIKILKRKQSKLKKDYKEPQEHFQAIRSGDYYLFDFDDNEKQDMNLVKPSPLQQNAGSSVDPTDDQMKGSEFTPTKSATDEFFINRTSFMKGSEFDPAKSVTDDFFINRTSFMKGSEFDPAKSVTDEFFINRTAFMKGSEFDPAKSVTDEFFINRTAFGQATECEREPTSVSRIRMVINIITTLWFSFIDWLILFCNKLSHNYRLVAKKLENDLITEKMKIVSPWNHELVFFAANALTLSLPEILKQEKCQMSFRDMEDITDTKSPPITESFDKSPCYSCLSLDELERQDENEIKQQFKDNSQRFSRLIGAGGLVLATHSELLCYFLMILDQMAYGSLLSLPLPLMVFLWGMLSVPRPSKTFWVTVITYTESVVVCKYLYQFSFFPWNDGTFKDYPFFPPRIIGIEKTAHYADMDIALLIALFLHRSILRKYGLWRDAADLTVDLDSEDLEKSLSELMEISQDEESSVRDLEETVSYEAVRISSKVRDGLAYIIDPFVTFFKQVTQSSYNATTDVYAPMFFCDFILFLVLVFGFSSFGPADTTGDENVTSYIQDSKIPIPFLIMLITQFIFIIIDRAIFLRKFVLGKFIFQILLVILIHVWMFFVLPATTKRSFFTNVASQLWYFIKCIYFGLSAHQIRCGYPNRILGNCLTKNYGYTNLILFKGFLAIPFLLELRALMDWIWTDSALAIGNWLQMEDIYANIFVLKCWREIEKSDAKPRGVNKSPLIKYIAGGALLIGIILIIWFPLVFFSLFNAVLTPNPPYEATITVGVGGYQPLFTSTALGDRICSPTEAEFSHLKAYFAKDKRAYTFLSGYEASDISLITFDGKSLSIWGISPVSQAALTEDLRSPSGGRLMFSVELKFLRKPHNTLSPEQSSYFELDLRNPSKENKDVAITLSKIISGSYNGSVNIYGAFPRFIRLVGSNNKVIEMEELLEGEYGIGRSNISLQLQTTSTVHLSEWWNLNETIKGPSVFSYSSTEKNYSKSQATVIVISDRKAPESLSFLSGYSIFRGGVVVMYVSFVLVVFKFVRVSFISGRILYIHLEEAPDLDYLLQVIDDMYLAREMKDYWLEEEIFAKLIFILRCPDVLFYVTRIRNIIPASPPPLVVSKTSVSEHRKMYKRLGSHGSAEEFQDVVLPNNC